MKVYSPVLILLLTSPCRVHVHGYGIDDEEHLLQKRRRKIFCGIFPKLCSSSSSPSSQPSDSPSTLPSTLPTSQPTEVASHVPSSDPSVSPTVSPSAAPTPQPSSVPSDMPSVEGSTLPTTLPTNIPSMAHSEVPTNEPSISHSQPPSFLHSTPPTSSSSPSSSSSSSSPSSSLQPTQTHSQTPSNNPSSSPTPLPSSTHSTDPSSTTTPSTSPTISPSDSPSLSSLPTLEASNQPSVLPTDLPSGVPSDNPTVELSDTPSAGPSEEPTLGPKPNLVVIMTDQHNLRTLGCYRDYFHAINQTEQAFVWGPNNIVETPHLDRLATEGALFTNFHTTTPLCTPNRASFMSGLYPASTGADRNHNAMLESVVTFAQVLKEAQGPGYEDGYDTAYFGKWHLNGQLRPGWGDESDFYDFGFTHKKYLFNQGHWKWIEELNNGKMKEYDYNQGVNKFRGREEKHFTTDFLFDRGMEFMEKNRLEGKPFVSFLSIPDPHAPKYVRKPYDTMFDDMVFQLPHTARTAAFKSPSTPLYNFHDMENVPLDDVEEYLQEYQNREFYQNSLQKYFGMVKCIDENIGKLLSYLDDAGIADNTIVAFTADHGDMLSEHGKFNKNRPYRTSAGIPFILRYPDKVMAGKIVETAYASVDFAPSILKVMNIPHPNVAFQGVDFSHELLSEEAVSTKDVVRFVFDSGNNMRWAAAVMKQYRLVISANDIPWLFDLQQDPYELQNFFDSDSIPEGIQQKLQNALFEAMPIHDIPLYFTNKIIYWSKPACLDSNDRLPTEAVNGVCDDLGVTIPFLDRCSKAKFQKHCPVTCASCCADSGGELLREGDFTVCDTVVNQNQCRFQKIAGFCPSSCNQCEA